MSVKQSSYIKAQVSGYLSKSVMRMLKTDQLPLHHGIRSRALPLSLLQILQSAHLCGCDSQGLLSLGQLSLKAMKSPLWLTRLITLSPILHVQGGVNIRSRL